MPSGSDNFFGQNTAADWRHIIATTGLKCGAFTVAGRQRVDGVDAIKLTGHTPAAGTTIWVDPGSYLPVRLTPTSAGPTAAGNGTAMTASTSAGCRRTGATPWQRAAPIPPRFREVGQPAPRAWLSG